MDKSLETHLHFTCIDSRPPHLTYNVENQYPQFQRILNPVGEEEQQRISKRIGTAFVKHS